MIAKQEPRATDEQQTRKQHKQKKKTPFSLRKKEKETEASTRNGKRKARRPIRRIFPIWLRLIVFILLCAGALIIGLMIGYGMLGDGSPKDVLNVETWKHIIDVVKKEK